MPTSTVSKAPGESPVGSGPKPTSTLSPSSSTSSSSAVKSNDADVSPAAMLTLMGTPP